MYRVLYTTSSPPIVIETTSGSSTLLLASWHVLELINLLLLFSPVKDVAARHSTWPLRSRERRHPRLVKIDWVADDKKVGMNERKKGRKKGRQENWSNKQDQWPGKLTFLYGSDGAALEGHSNPPKPQRSRP